MNLYRPAVTKGDKIAQMLIVPAGLRAGSTPSQRRNAHLRWGLCSMLCFAAWAVIQHQQARIAELEAREGEGFWDGVDAGRSLSAA